ncbi:MAG: sensor histidine kinase [Christensenellales bacterium]
MDYLIYANIALDIFCIILSTLPIFYLVSNHRYRQKLNQFFLGACISNTVMIAGDLPDWIFPTIASFPERIILSAATALYYVASAFVLYFFIRYIMEYLQLTGRAKKVCLIYAMVLCGIQIVFALISPFTDSIFYVTADGYQRGPLFLISQFVPLFCYLLFMALIIIYRGKLLRREVIFFLLYIFIPLGCGAVQMAMRGIAIVNAGVTIATLIILMNVQFEHEVTMKEQERELAEHRIDIMLSQIQPHFLYNSLGAIYHLCESDPRTARKAIKNFSEFLRGNMESLKSREPIAFEAELNHAANYLYLEQQRFGDKLQVIYQITTEDFLIPPLTLQPLVENAVQHGVLNRRNGGTIVIRTEKTDECAVVMVFDNGVGMEKAKGIHSLGDRAHIGISNVRSRLKEMMGGSLDIESSGEGTTAIIRIPWTEGGGA